MVGVLRAGPARAFAETSGAPAAPGPLRIGRVVGCDEAGVAITVRTDEAEVAAGVAVSCLIRPVIDDRVLLVEAGGEAFVLSVLERVGPNYATLALPGHGNLAIEGETLSLRARQRLALRGDRVDLQGRTMAFVADSATWLGKALTAVVGVWRVSAREHQTSAETMTEKATTRIAVVDQLDSLSADARSVKIAGIASETAHSKVVAVAEDLRMDGKRISMG